MKLYLAIATIYMLDALALALLKHSWRRVMLACGIALWYSTFQEQKNGRFPGLMIYSICVAASPNRGARASGWVWWE